MKHLKARKHHSKAFRKQAVELLLTGRTLTDLASELHVGVTTLQEWKEEYLAELDHQPPDATTLSPLQMQEEFSGCAKRTKNSNCIRKS